MDAKNTTTVERLNERGEWTTLVVELVGALPDNTPEMSDADAAAFVAAK